MLLKSLILAQLAGTLFTGALYDGGGDTYHPYFHLAVGARFEAGPAGVEALHAPTIIRGVVDLYATRVVGTWSTRSAFIRGGFGWSLWRLWGADSKPHKEAEGISTTLGGGIRLPPAVAEIRWEWFPYDNAPIRNGLLITLGLRFD